MDFTFITANDIHVSDNGPRNRTDDFKAAVFNKINQVRLVCEKLKADAFLIAGDLYNLKTPSKNSHHLNKELIKEFKKFSCPIYMIEGNHDLTGNNLESLESQPLGVLFEAKTLIQLRHEIIEKNGTKISLVGIPYTENLDLKDLKIPQKKDCVSQICLLHLYAGLKGGYLFKERLYGYNELSTFSPDVFVIGHYHLDQGIHNENGKYFINIGSFTRGTLSEDDIKHQPQMGMIKITVENSKIEYKVQSIKLKVKPADEIFDLLKKEEEIKESKELKEFIDKLSFEITDNKKELNFKDSVNKLVMPEEVRKKVLFYIEKVRS